MKTVEVRFNDCSYGTRNKSYHYLVDDDVSVQVGDTAVVHNGSELRLVYVVSVKAGVSAQATKTLVTVIDKTAMDSYFKRNEEIKENKKLFERLEQLLAMESEVSKYRRLAENSSEAREILQKLNIIGE